MTTGSSTIVSEAAVAAPVPAVGPLARVLSTAARQRELSLLLILLAMGVLVATQAPQVLSATNLTDVSVLAAIIAIAAVGEAMVVITRNVDLSVEAVIGLVAFVVADILGTGALPTPVAMLVGIGLGLVLGMVNGFVVAVLRVPSIVATLGTLSIYRGIDFLLAGGKQVTLTSLPAGYTEIARSTLSGIPVFVLVAVAIVVAFGILLRVTRFGRSVYAVGSNPEAAGILGISTRQGHVRRVRAVRPAGRCRRRDVGDPVRDDQRHGRVGGDAQVIAAVVVAASTSSAGRGPSSGRPWARCSSASSPMP